jgi:hypothetical protein
MLKSRCAKIIKIEDNETKTGKGARKLITMIEEFILQLFLLLFLLTKFQSKETLVKYYTTS